MKLFRRVGGVAVVGLLAATLSSAPAHAKESDGYVRGYDTYVGDWSDEGTLSRNDSSNGVCLWQKVLWAEGAEEENGTAFDQSDIDGHFGLNTMHATQDLGTRWDWRNNRTWVSGDLFGRADNQLEYKSGSSGRGGTLELRYNGSAHNTTMIRDAAGRYKFYDKNGTVRTASYTANTCD